MVWISVKMKNLWYLQRRFRLIKDTHAYIFDYNFTKVEIRTEFFLYIYISNCYTFLSLIGTTFLKEELIEGIIYIFSESNSNSRNLTFIEFICSPLCLLTNSLNINKFITHAKQAVSPRLIFYHIYEITFLH